MSNFTYITIPHNPKHRSGKQKNETHEMIIK